MGAWIGVDLDGTLAHSINKSGFGTIGSPIPVMLKRIQRWISEGKEVKIFTARASAPQMIPEIQNWLESIGLPRLEVTNVKDFGMIQLWDDIAIGVQVNTGEVRK